MNIEIDILGTEDALNTWTLGSATVNLQNPAGAVR